MFFKKAKRLLAGACIAAMLFTSVGENVMVAMAAESNVAQTVAGTEDVSGADTVTVPVADVSAADVSGADVSDSDVIEIPAVDVSTGAPEKEVPAEVTNEEPVVEEELNAASYTINNGTLTFAASVVGVGDNAFKYIKDNAEHESIVRITFEEGSMVKALGNYSFYQLPNLQTVDLTNCTKLTYIGEYAFAGCKQLNSVQFPAELMEIQKYAFNNCTSLTSITLKSGLNEIGMSAFQGCTALSSVTVETQNLTCGNNIFATCGLQEINFASNNTVVPSKLFYGAKFAEGTTVVIPYHIQEIGASAFYNCKTLEAIEFENTVAKPSALASIAEGAFYGCELLKSVEFPESVKTIEKNAFYGCIGLTSLEIPNTVTVLGEAAFKKCSSVAEVSISNAISTLGASVFEECSSLTNVVIPAGIAEISDKMFKKCTGLVSITVPSTVKTVGESAFEGCSSLPTIVLPNTVTSVGKAAFKQCTVLDNPIMPKDLAEYPTELFYECGSLGIISTSAKAGSYVRGLEIPVAVTSIGERAFEDCDSITALTIPQNVTNIGKNAFADCQIIGRVTIESLKIAKCGAGIFQACLLMEVVFPEGITEIPAYLFSNAGFNTQATVTIPKTVTGIGKYAFGGTKEAPTTVTAIYFEDGTKVESFGENAFSYCIAVEAFTIPESVTTIGKNAFNGCKKLAAITIPENVTSIGMSAFSGCEVLTTVNFNAIDCTITKTSNNMGIFEDCNIHTILIGNRVKTLPAYMFRGAKFSTNQNTDEVVLIELDIPASVETIGEYAFANIVNLVGINIAEGSALQEVGTSAFYSCTALEECNLPDTVTSIGNAAFSDCSSLAAMELPASLEYLGSSAFKNCPLITSYVVPAGTTAILDTTFYGNDALETVVFRGLNITQIGANAFAECPELIEIDIPQGTTSIGETAFLNDTSLTKVRIPASVTSIGTDAFKNCPNVEFYVVTGSYAEQWLRENGFGDKINSMYSITYELDGGVNDPRNPGGYKVGETVQLYPATKPGYDFAGWYLDAGYVNPVTEISNRSEDITIYARWTLATYTINYNLDGGVNSEANPTTYTINDEITLENATKSGHDFKGWYTNSGFTGNKKTKIAVGSYGDLDLYAKFTVKTPTVKFDAGKGTVSEKSRKVTFGKTYGEKSTGEKADLPTPTRSGYLFDGWYTDDNKLITKDSVVENEENHTLTARWCLDVKVAAPTANYASGTQVFKGTKVMLSTETPGAYVYYTVDGTKPTMSSTLYTDAIEITKPTTIRAIAVKDGYKNSDVAAFTYTVVDEASYWGDIAEEDRALFANGTEVPQGIWVAGVEDAIYTGKAITFDLRVYDHKTLLTNKTDYTVKYTNNKAAATKDAKKAPTVTITSKGNYKGKAVIKFNIVPVSISLGEFAADDVYVALGKKAVKPIPVVTWGKTKLKNKTDFTVTYKDQSGNEVESLASAGEYSLIINGKGNYSGSKTIKCVVTEATLMSKVKVSGVKAATYTGSAITQPNMVVKSGKNELTVGTDYDVRYENNTEVGTATIVLTGKGYYAGVKKVTFKINPVATINKATIKFNKTSVVYTGSAIKLNQGSDPLKFETIAYKGTPLVEGVDYVIDGYEKNTNVGTAKVVIRGIGKYSGTVKKSFKITAADIAGLAVKLVDAEGNAVNTASYIYSKGGCKPAVYLTYGGKALVAGQDYTVSYKNNTKTGTATVTVKGKKNFKGSTPATSFTITKQNIGNVTMTVADVAYQEKAGIYASKPVLTDLDGKKLVSGKDYDKTVTYTYAFDTYVKEGKKSNVFRAEGTEVGKEDIIPAGTMIKATVKGIGNYEKENEVIFRIVKNNIAKAKVTVTPQVYTGKAVEPGKDQIIVKLNGTELNREDYEIVGYSKNINKGTATVTLRGAGENYGGTITAKFKINQKGFDLLSFLKLLGF